MTDGERLWTGIALSLFLHFSLTLFHGSPQEETPAFHATLEMERESVLTQGTMRQGTGLQSASVQERGQTEARNQKRRAYLRYLEDVDNAIHARRLIFGDTGLIGMALCAFTIQPDGSFSDARIVSTSGRPELDAAALRAIYAASGVVRRPDILGPNPIHVSLQVKYQYGLQ